MKVLTIISKILTGAAAIWMISQLFYKEINWWSVWAFLICCIIMVIVSTIRLHKDNMEMQRHYWEEHERKQRINPKN